MITTMQLRNRFPLKISIGLAGAALIALAVIILTPSPAPAQPVISWMPESINETVLAGETKAVSFSFTASEDLGAVEVGVVPELEPYVTTNPTSFTSITAGQTINLDITISAPADASPQVVNGTIQIRNAGRPPRNFARPLPVTVEVWQSVTEKGIAIGYPSEWQLNQRPLSLGGPISLNNFANMYQQGGVIPEGGATIDITTIPLPASPVSDVIANDLQGATIESTSTRLVGGETGTEVVYTIMFTQGFTEKNVAIYIPHNELLYKFFLSYRAGEPSENQFLTDFQRILDTVPYGKNI